MVKRPLIILVEVFDIVSHRCVQKATGLMIYADSRYADRIKKRSMINNGQQIFIISHGETSSRSC
jgi:hypothetical protein